MSDETMTKSMTHEYMLNKFIDEVDGSEEYYKLCKESSDPEEKMLLHAMAKDEFEHAQFWREKLEESQYAITDKYLSKHEMARSRFR